MKIVKEDLNKIGNTPLVQLNKIEEYFHLSSHIYAKLESYNPGGSIKDRIAYKLLMDAKEKGLLDKDSIIMEPTSGNTGIGLAWISKLLGYKCVIVMPENMSEERKKLISSYGAGLILTPKELGMSGAIQYVEENIKKNPHIFVPSQFDNKLNPLAHYETTGPEIYKDLPNVDIFIAGVGTGGTLSGVGRYLKEKNKDVKVIAVEPLSSPVLSKGEKGPHQIQGIGAGFIPNTLDTSIYDEVMPISDHNAFTYMHLLKEVEELSCGLSSGAALSASIETAKKYKDKNIVVIFPDTGERYLTVEER